jgi:hypothetical protein
VLVVLAISVCAASRLVINAIGAAVGLGYQWAQLELGRFKTQRIVAFFALAVFKIHYLPAVGAAKEFHTEFGLIRWL